MKFASVRAINRSYPLLVFMGSWYSVCVCVCVIISKSKEVTVLKHGNHIQSVVLYKTEKFFLAKATQITSELGNKKLIVQISHERLLNQANGCILLGA